ncbi:MAG: OmpA family protein [Thiohalobacteraceae bacterium]
MNTSKIRHPLNTSLAALLVAGGLTVAPVSADEHAEGYVDDSASSVVRNNFGECWHTSSWSKDSTIEECDPSQVAAAPEPEPVPPAEPLRTVRRINLESDTYFAFDKDELRPEGQAKLDELVAEMQRAQEPRLQITGYTDRIGTEDYNMDLSNRRAVAVKEYLVGKGIETDIIETTAMGERNPVVNCEGKSGNDLIQCLAPNRRTVVEFSAFEIIEESPQQ